MLLVILLIGIAMIVMGCVVVYKAQYPEDNPLTYVGFIVGIMFTLTSIVCLIVGGVTLSESRVIDAKIEMCMEENTRIETNVTGTVEKYLEYEFAIFDNLQGEDIQTLLVIYPEINSNELVKQQIQIFTTNNTTIKELKTQKLNIDIWRFWVYFG